MAKPFSLAIILLALITILQLTTLYLINRSPASPYILPKLMWVYWDTPDRPSIIEKIKRHNSTSLIGWTVIYLDNTMLSTYIPKEAYPQNFDAIGAAAKSDWIRLYLLSTYGGCWMDAAIVVNTPDAMLDLYNESLMSEADLICFQTGPQTFVHRTGRILPKLIDSWCIMAPLRSRLVKLWREEFERAIDMGFLAYKQETLRRGIDLSAIYFDSPEDTYLTVHIAIQAVVQNPSLNLPILLIKQSSESMFRIQEECKGDLKCFADRFNNDPIAKSLPYIKLSRYERKRDIDGFFKQA